MPAKENIQTRWSDRSRIFGLPITFTKYSMSDDRIFCEKGLLNMKFEEILLYRVRDISMKITLGQRIFGVGSILLQSSDKTAPVLEIKNVKNPRQVKEMIHQQVEQVKEQRRMRFGEDIDFSIRLFKGGYKVCLFPSAWVYHKRRTDWRKFYRQVYNFGIARINLYKKYPDSLKVVHLLPAVFTLGCLVLLLGALVCPWALLPLVLYALLIGIDASRANRSLRIGALAIFASFIQLLGYGCGFLVAFWRRIVRGKDEFSAFQKTFYK